MAGIGEDIKEVLEELGSTVTVVKPNGTTFIEKVDLTEYPTSSTEFIRQYFASLTLFHDTLIVSGDVLLVNGQYYLVVKSTESSFENFTVDYTASGYRCNVYGRVKRLTETRDPVTYLTIPAWGNIGNAVRGLQHEGRFNNEMVLEQDMVGLSRFQHSLYLPSYMNIIVGDRWYPVENSTTEYYRVSNIDKKRLDNVIICELKEDSRE